MKSAKIIKTMVSVGIVVVILVVFLVIYLCFWISTFRKKVLWRKDNIRITGIVNSETGIREFSRLYIGDPNNFLDDEIHIGIEASDATLIPLKNINVEKLKSMKNVSFRDSYATIIDYDYSDRRWPKNTTFALIYKPDQNSDIKISYNIYSFAIVDGNVAGFILYENDYYGFWDTITKKKYQSPIFQEQIEEVFGKPDKVKEFFSK